MNATSFLLNLSPLSFNFHNFLGIFILVKKPRKKKKPKPRLPIEAVLKLRSHPVTTEKGKKGYDRKNIKEQAREIIEEEKGS
jgi:hypothetical protein